MTPAPRKFTMRTTSHGPRMQAGLARLKTDELLLMLLLAGLGTISHTLSVSTVAGIPVAVVVLCLLAWSFRHDTACAVRESRTLRQMLILWTIWVAITLFRLMVDLPTFGPDALRDSVITISFGALFVGAGASHRLGSENILRASYLFSVALGFFALLSLFDSLLPSSVRNFLSFQNVGISGIALLAAGLWTKRPWYRLACLTLGICVLLVAQARMLYLVAIAVILVFLLCATGRQEGRPLRSRSSRMASLAAVSVILVLGSSIISSVPFVTGRLTSVSIDSMGELIGSVFDDDSVFAGSRLDRQEWSTNIIAKMQAEPTTVITGVGLGPDLLNGYRSSDGALVRKPHNDYLEAFARTGVAASIALSTIVISGLYNATRLISRDGRWGYIFGWILAAAASALSQPYLSYPHGAMLLAFAIGTVLVASRDLRSGPQLASHIPLGSTAFRHPASHRSRVSKNNLRKD